MQEYYLMNKDEKLLRFSTEQTLGSTNVVEKERFSSYMPPGFFDIATWVEQRNYAKHKEHMQKWLKDWQIDTIDGFLNITHALGINDCLWVKTADSALTWNQVSLYQNDFDDVASKTAFETGLYGLKLSSASPEFTADGSFPKCWIKNSAGILLCKAGATGAANVGLEPYSEYMMSQICNELSLYKTTPYDLIKYKTKTCSVCGLFTDENIGFAPAYRFIDSNKTYRLTDMLKLCSVLGFEQQFREMILLDSICFNQDRHLGNFGFLVDNDTFDIVGFAPYFDFNISMLCNAMPEDLKDFAKYEEDYRVGHKLGGRFAEVGKEIATEPRLRSLPKELHLPMHDRYNLPIDRMDRLEEIFEKNYNAILGKDKLFPVSLGCDKSEPDDLQ